MKEQGLCYMNINMYEWLKPTDPLKFWVMILHRQSPNVICFRYQTSAWLEWTVGASSGAPDIVQRAVPLDVMVENQSSVTLPMY